MLRLSLRRRRQLLPWLFLGPGLLWLIVFFALPLVNQVNVSLQSGDAETGYAFDWAFSTYSDAIRTTTSSSSARSATPRRRPCCA